MDSALGHELVFTNPSLKLQPKLERRGHHRRPFLCRVLVACKATVSEL